MLCFYKIGNNVPTFISDFSYLSLFSFFLVNVAKYLSIFIFLKELNLGFVDILYCFSLLKTFISTLIFIISFLLLALGLVCSFFFLVP